jgi:hypothetical protein
MTPTDELIRRLAAQPAVAAGHRAGPAAAAGLGLLAAAALTAAGIGVRHDLAAALAAPALPLKLLALAGLAASALAAIRWLCRPGSAPGAGAVLGAAAAAALAAAVAAALMAFVAGSAATPPAAVVVACMVRIGIISVPAAILIFAALRRSAPVRPALAGAAAGLLAAATGALGYAIACPLDDPATVAACYGGSLIGLAGLGALAGRRLLAW